MSVDYYLLCIDDGKYIHVAQDGMSGFTFYHGEPDCMKSLSQFLENRKGGEFKFVPEHFAHELPESDEVRWIPKHLAI